MTVDERIRFTAAFFPRWRADLERCRRSFELPADRKMKALSRGSTKLALLLALCRGAELLILDEPSRRRTGRHLEPGPALAARHLHASGEMIAHLARACLPAVRAVGQADSISRRLILSASCRLFA